MRKRTSVLKEKPDPTIPTSEINEILTPDDDMSSSFSSPKTEVNNGAAIEAITLLVQAVIEQNRVIAAQQESFQNAMSNILNHQMKVIEEISESQTKNDFLVPAMSSDEINDVTFNHLQKIKDEISIVAETIGNPKVNEALEKANENLEKGQNILSNLVNDKSDKNETPR